MSSWHRLSRTSAPEEPLLSLDDAKAHLNVSHDDDDDLITALVEAVTAYIDGPEGVGVALVEQSWRYSMDGLSSCFRIPLRPVSAVTSITYVDEAGQTQTLDPALYTLDLDTQPPIVARAWNATYPSVRCQPGSVKVNFTCGYGAPSDVPADIRQAAKLLLGHWYENREAMVDGGKVEPPHAVNAILGKYRALSFT